MAKFLNLNSESKASLVKKHLDSKIQELNSRPTQIGGNPRKQHTPDIKVSANRLEVDDDTINDLLYILYREYPLTEGPLRHLNKGGIIPPLALELRRMHKNNELIIEE